MQTMDGVCYVYRLSSTVLSSGMHRALLLLLVPLAACRIEKAASGRPPGPPTEADSLALVEQDSVLNAVVTATLRAYYARRSDRDWRAVRRSFVPGAILTWRDSGGGRPERVRSQTVEEFVRRGPDGPGRMAVFNERMLHAHVSGYGDLASAWVVFERRSGMGRDSLRVERGVDAFQLYRDGGEWRIAGLASTVEQPGRLLAPPGPARR